MAAIEGTGATLTLGTTGVTLLATSISSAGITWEAVPTTHLATSAAKTFVRGDLYDPGTVNVNFLTEPEQLDSLINCAASEVVTITYPDAGAATEVATGFVTNLDPGTCEVDTPVAGSLTIKRTGTVVFTD